LSPVSAKHRSQILVTKLNPKENMFKLQPIIVGNKIQQWPPEINTIALGDDKCQIALVISPKLMDLVSCLQIPFESNVAGPSGTWESNPPWLGLGTLTEHHN